MNLRPLLARLLPSFGFTYSRIVDDSELSDAERALLQEHQEFRATFENVYADAAGGPYTCPCCGHPTLPSRGNYDLCPECHWEDDGQDDHDSATVRSGPNGLLSLDAAREAYQAPGGHRRPHTVPVAPTSSLG